MPWTLFGGVVGESAAEAPGDLLTLEGMLENIAVSTGPSFVGSVAWRSREGVCDTTATCLGTCCIILICEAGELNPGLVYPRQVARVSEPGQRRNPK